MGEVTEKIYCCDRGDNDNALAAAILQVITAETIGGPMAAMMDEELLDRINQLESKL